jgi:hypothetical protein
MCLNWINALLAVFGDFVDSYIDEGDEGDDAFGVRLLTFGFF